MIKIIHIQNFQSHKDTLLELDPGVNIIVGSSDSGKTAIIRALRWLVWNRPGGDTFRSSWGGDTAVEVEVDNVLVRRGRTKILNYYQCNEQEPFFAFGTDVPDEVKKILNFNEINLQSQFDQPFLLTSSPGEVATHFNRIAHIDKIDTATRAVQSWIREITQNIDSYTKQINKAEEELTTFDYLPKAEIEVEVLEGMETKLNQTRTAKTLLVKQIEKICQITEEIKEQSEILKIEPEVIQLLALYKSQDELKIQSKSLVAVIASLAILEITISEKEQTIKAEKTVNSLLELIKEKEALSNQLKLLSQTVYNAISVVGQYNHTTKELNALKTRYNEEFPDQCPLCGQKVNRNIL